MSYTFLKTAALKSATAKDPVYWIVISTNCYFLVWIHESNKSFRELWPVKIILELLCIRSKYYVLCVRKQRKYIWQFWVTLNFLCRPNIPILPTTVFIQSLDCSKKTAVLAHFTVYRSFYCICPKKKPHKNSNKNQIITSSLSD